MCFKPDVCFVAGTFLWNRCEVLDLVHPFNTGRRALLVTRNRNRELELPLRSSTASFQRMNRREALANLGVLPVIAAAAPLLGLSGCKNANEREASTRKSEERVHPHRAVVDQPSNFDPEGKRLLEEVSERSAHYFFDQADPDTGLVYDRARADGGSNTRTRPLASIAATGFGLSALCVASNRGFLPQCLCEERIMRTLMTVARRVPHQHGFLAHYLNAKTCGLLDPEEYSSIDTALFLAGALHAAQFINSREADAAMAEIYRRVDWPWMTNAGATLVMGWAPESGFQNIRWDSYSECLLMYLLAIGSPTHPLPASAWQGIQRNTYDYGGIRFISSVGALFIHQYPHIWLDLRGLHDGHTDYFQNSISAMRAHKTWCMLQHGRFSWIDERTWGFSASDTPRESYSAWGAPPEIETWDGTLAPHAAGGGIALMPEECVTVLKAIRDHHPKAFQRYGFVNAFNPGASAAGWYDPDIISIDLGLTMLMIENQRSGSIRTTGNQIPALASAMTQVGFVRE